MEIGHYRVERQLADGPQKALYEAVDRRSGQRVVIRSMKLKANAALLSRLAAQARALLPLRELGAVVPSDWGSDSAGFLYVVSPFITGQSLAEKLSAHSGEPLPGALLLGHKLSRLLAGAHAAGIVHLALRPGQVLLVPAEPPAARAPGGEQEPRLLYLGLRQALGMNEAPQADPLWRTYIAPEQQQGAPVGEGSAAAAGADVFSLGVMLWHALSGTNPLAMTHSDATLRASDKQAKLPPELPPLFLRMLKPAAGDRPTMAEVAAVFARLAPKEVDDPAKGPVADPAIDPLASTLAPNFAGPEEVPSPDSFQTHVAVLEGAAAAAAAPPDPMAGVLFGNFRVVRKLGEGGMGAVYEARHRKIGRRAAIKIMHGEFTKSPDFAARFLNEARAVNIISHPGLVQIFEYGRKDDGTLFIVMEFLEGESLSQRIQKRKQPFAEAEVLHVGKQLARALTVAHEKGIIHRDLKPENIMLVPDPITQQQDWVKILDFGIAKVAPSSRQGPKPGTNRTEAGATIGTPKYMAPEQFGQAESVDGRADVFSLGVVLYEMLTGVAPYPGTSLALFKKPLRPLREQRPTVSPALAELVTQMLEPQAESRPAMAEVADRLSPASVASPAPGAAAAPPLVLAASSAPSPASFSTPEPVSSPLPAPLPAEGVSAPSAQSKKEAAVAGRKRLYGAIGITAVLAVVGVLAWQWYFPPRVGASAARTLALSTLSAGLKSLDSATALRAVSAIGSSGDLRYRTLLEPLLQTDKPQLVAAAARALGQLGAVDAQPLLLELLSKNKDPAVAIMAADSLSRLKHPEGTQQLLTMMEQGEPEVRIQAATLLLEQGNLAGSGMLWERLARGSLSEMAALVTMGQLAFAGDQRARQLLETKLRQASGQGRLFAAWNLSRLGDEEARALLLNAVAQPGPEQLLAAQLAAALGEPRGYELLLRAATAEKEPDAVRELGIAGLSDCGKEEAITPLYRILSRGHLSEPLQLAAAGAILHLVSGARSELAQQSLSWAMAALGSDSAVTRELATAALGEIGADESIPPLSKALRDQQRQVRRAAARALGQKSARAALDALSDSLDDQDVEVRAAGLHAIQRVVGSLRKKGDKEADKQILARLQRMAREGGGQGQSHDPDRDQDRVAASGILLQLGDRGQQARLLEAFSSRDALVRRLAVEYADADESLLERALRDSELGVRFVAARRLADRGSHLGVAVLREVAQGGEIDGLVAYTKLKALGEAADPPAGLSQLLQSADLKTRLDALDIVADFPSDRALSLLYIASRDPAAAIRRRSAELAGLFYKRTGIGVYLNLVRNLLRDPESLVRSGASELLLSLPARPPEPPAAAPPPQERPAPSPPADAGGLSRVAETDANRIHNEPGYGGVDQRSDVIGYVRVSTDMQASEGVSLDAQRERITHYCRANGYRLIGVISDELSGKSLERPGLQKALGMMESGKAGALVVVKIDRLTRSILDLGSLLHKYFAREEQGRLKYRLLSVTESLDTTNPMGRFVVYILGLIAQWERESISERTRDAMQHLKAQGVKFGRATYGYRYIASADPSGRRTLEPVPEQQEVIRRIIKMREAGQLQEAICNTLNDEGLPSPFGQHWRRLMIHRLLKAANMTTPRNQPAARRPTRVIQRDKARAVERARALRVEGLSLRVIGERLLEEGLYPARGNVWHASQIMDFVQVPDPSGAGPLAAKLRADGLALVEIGRRLNYQGYMSPSGGLWDRKTLSDLITRHAGVAGAMA